MFYLRVVTRKFKRFFRLARETFMGLSVVGKTAVWEAKTRLLATERYAHPKRLQRFGAKSWSQTDEDGIITEIFTRIGSTSRTFVELGIGNGLENNTVNLLLKGWKGVWIDGNHKNVRKIQAAFENYLNTRKLTLHSKFITMDNVHEVSRHLESGAASTAAPEIDLLSIDIDGNDYYMAEQLLNLNPRVVVMEYNCKMDASTDLVMNYDPDHVWDGTDCFGSSLKSFEKLFAQRGYSLVGCTLSGINAFFVRNDCLGEHFLAPFTSENHFEPGRYWLAQAYTINSGHPPSYDTIRKFAAIRDLDAVKPGFRSANLRIGPDVTPDGETKVEPTISPATYN